MLYTKCIFKEIELSDGIRISVMSRHTLNDGKTPDPRITPQCFDEWLQELAPPAKLIGDYYKRDLPWEDFERRYTHHLRTQSVSTLVQSLAERATLTDITLLCVEETTERCHRRLLAAECQTYEKSLEIHHR
ncbi:MAG: hypothetical protein CMH61_00170 [Nanoarchaeota archaeon]|nr:hypothetical protein [Nanoarchaeota archaeon]|tara:strand:+ start:2407 stop:2802 length:396 start_codon:yes stop_codon:yes gene_type:complete